jgi:signal transduction histidine kinase
MNKVFQPYFTTKKGMGMGLGLNIAKKALESHGATISVDSRLGVGTKFTIIFPVADEELSVDNIQKNIYNSI